MQAGLQQVVTSLETTQFTEGLINNAASAMYNLQMPVALNNQRGIVRAISVVTMENFAPEFNFFSGAAGVNADPQLDLFLGQYGFLAAQGLRFAAAGVYRYFISGLAIPYYDQDNPTSNSPSRLHVVLANRSATAKSAAAAGYITARFWIEQLAEGR